MGSATSASDGSAAGPPTRSATGSATGVATGSPAGPATGSTGSAGSTTRAGSRDGRKAAARAAVEAALGDLELEYEQQGPDAYVVKLPGEHKLWTTCSLVVGDHTLSLNAFVARRPDENHEGVYRWLLERNTRLGSLAFALDRLGDVYLVGRLPLGLVTPGDVDQLLGEAVSASDSSFDQLLELGFAGAIRREWDWRVSRGESLQNLAAFAHLIEKPVDDGEAAAAGSEPPIDFEAQAESAS